MRQPVLAVMLFRHIPPSSEMGVTTTELAAALGEPPRRVQRYLAALEEGGLVRREPHEQRGQGGWRPARWWRA